MGGLLALNDALAALAVCCPAQEEGPSVVEGEEGRARRLQLLLRLAFAVYDVQRCDLLGWVDPLDPHGLCLYVCVDR